MSEEYEKAVGGCHCGTVRYEVVGKPNFVGCCHCESCRKTTGAPMVVYATYLKEQVRFTKGKRKIYESSPGVGRTFCSNCGTPLTYEGEWAGETVIGFFMSVVRRRRSARRGARGVKRIKTKVQRTFVQLNGLATDSGPWTCKREQGRRSAASRALEPAPR